MLASRPFNAADGILVDTSTKLSRSLAEGLWAAGVRGVWRYFFFGSPRPGDLDAAELQMLLGLGFWVGGVQHVPFPGWHSDGPTGKAHAQACVANAIRAGFVTPDGCHPVALALDCEGAGNPPGMPDYARNGFQVRAQHGYQNVGYMGYDSGLRGADLDAMNADTSCGDPAWWCDFATMASRPAPKKGYAGHQRAQQAIAGIGVDVDTVLQDGVLYGLVEDAGDRFVQINDLATGGELDPAELPTRPEIPNPK